MKSSWTLTKVLDDSRSEVSPWLPVLTLIVLLSTAILWLLTACTDPGARWYPVVSGGIRWSWDTFWWAREYSHRGTCRGAPRDAMKCHKRLPTCSHIQSVGTITPLTRLIKFPSFPYSFPTISHQKKEVKSIQIYSDLRSPPADSYGIYGSSSPLEPGSCSQTVWLPSQDLVAECCSCFLPRSV